MRSHLTPGRMAIIKKSTNNTGEGVEKKEPSYTVHRNVNGAATAENSMEVTLKTKNKSYHMILHSHCWPYSWTKLLTQKDICIPMFIAALFTIAKT